MNQNNTLLQVEEFPIHLGENNENCNTLTSSAVFECIINIYDDLDELYHGDGEEYGKIFIHLSENFAEIITIFQEKNRDEKFLFATNLGKITAGINSRYIDNYEELLQIIENKLIPELTNGSETLLRLLLEESKINLRNKINDLNVLNYYSYEYYYNNSYIKSYYENVTDYLGNISEIESKDFNKKLSNYSEYIDKDAPLNNITHILTPNMKIIDLDELPSITDHHKNICDKWQKWYDECEQNGFHIHEEVLLEMGNNIEDIYVYESKKNGKESACEFIKEISISREFELFIRYKTQGFESKFSKFGYSNNNLSNLHSSLHSQNGVAVLLKGIQSSFYQLSIGGKVTYIELAKNLSEIEIHQLEKMLIKEGLFFLTIINSLVKEKGVCTVGELYNFMKHNESQAVLALYYNMLGYNNTEFYHNFDQKVIQEATTKFESEGYNPDKEIQTFFRIQLYKFARNFMKKNLQNGPDIRQSLLQGLIQENFSKGMTLKIIGEDKNFEKTTVQELNTNLRGLKFDIVKGTGLIENTDVVSMMNEENYKNPGRFSKDDFIQIMEWIKIAHENDQKYFDFSLQYMGKDFNNKNSNFVFLRDENNILKGVCKIEEKIDVATGEKIYYYGTHYVDEKFQGMYSVGSLLKKVLENEVSKGSELHGNVGIENHKSLITHIEFSGGIGVGFTNLMQRSFMNFKLNYSYNFASKDRNLKNIDDFAKLDNTQIRVFVPHNKKDYKLFETESQELFDIGYVLTRILSKGGVYTYVYELLPQINMEAIKEKKCNFEGKTIRIYLEGPGYGEKNFTLVGIEQINNTLITAYMGNEMTPFTVDINQLRIGGNLGSWIPGDTIFPMLESDYIIKEIEISVAKE